MIEMLGITIHSKVIYTLSIIVFGFLFYRLSIILINKSFAVKMKRIHLDKRKQQTVKVLINNVLKYTFVIFGFLTILSLWGVNTGAIIASIGVAGLAIGLAVQDTLKDLIAGSFILVENQYAIGDIVTIGNFKGEVIFLGLRTTKIRSETGEVKILSNRNISDVTNFSLHNTVLYIDIDLKSDNDQLLVEKLLNDLSVKLSNDIKNIKSNFSYIGIEKIGDKVTYRLRVETDAKSQDEVRRRAWGAIKRELNKNEVR